MSLSKPRPILKDMPYHIKKMIVESIPSYLERLPLRKVSKEFMGVVDTAKVEMTFEIHHKTVRIEVKTPNCLVKQHTTATEAINHFKCFISKKNVTFSMLIIYGDRALSVELLEMLTATVKRPLQVKGFGMSRGGQAKLLEFLEPGTLEGIALIDIDNDEAERVFGMEQWKQARIVFTYSIPAACEVWWNIPTFAIHNNPAIDETDLPRILEHVSNLATFVCGKIFNTWTIEEIVEALGGGDWESKQDDELFAEKKFTFPRNESRIIVKAYENKVFFVKE